MEVEPAVGGEQSLPACRESELTELVAEVRLKLAGENLIDIHSFHDL
jgi:hypothetical protein